MAPRACNTRFLKKEFDFAEIFEFKIFPSYVTQSVPKSVPLRQNQRQNPFWIGSAYIELHSANAEKLLNEELEIGCNFPLC